MGNCLRGSKTGKTGHATYQPVHTVTTAQQQQKQQEQQRYSPPSAPVKASPPRFTPAKPPAPKVEPIGSVLGRPMQDVRSIYNLGKELGRGQFGVTYLCTEKATGALFACKSIAKRKLANKDDIEDVKREVQIMNHLMGQPNIVEMKGAYEDKHAVHLVMELCAGGELFDRIIAKGHYSERAAASLCRTIVQVVHICHSNGVMHRDLKPENFLLLSKEENSPLKATDFGLSVFIEPDTNCYITPVNCEQPIGTEKS